MYTLFAFSIPDEKQSIEYVQTKVYSKIDVRSGRLEVRGYVGAGFHASSVRSEYTEENRNGFAGMP